METRMPKHVQREVTRHGKTVYYYRKTGARRVRLHNEFGSAAFWESYALAASGAEQPGDQSEQRGQDGEEEDCALAHRSPYDGFVIS
jgi:hypothetical protein